MLLNNQRATTNLMISVTDSGKLKQNIFLESYSHPPGQTDETDSISPQAVA
jgi:hypothetical protein